MIDLTRNIESTPEAETGKKDPLWVSFLDKGDNADHFLSMLKSYRAAEDRQQAKEVWVDGDLRSSYQESMSQLREDVIQKVQNRFHFYEQRKNKYIE